MAYVIARMFAASRQSRGFLAGLINPAKIAVAGHSDGGDTVAALAANTCCRDPAVTAAIVLAGVERPQCPAPTSPQPTPPILFVQGDAEHVIRRQHHRCTRPTGPARGSTSTCSGKDTSPPTKTRIPPSRSWPGSPPTSWTVTWRGRPARMRHDGHVAGVATLVQREPAPAETAARPGLRGCGRDQGRLWPRWCGRAAAWSPGRWHREGELRDGAGTVADVRADRTVITHGDRSLTWRRAGRSGVAAGRVPRRARRRHRGPGGDRALQRHRVPGEHLRGAQAAGDPGQRELPIPARGDAATSSTTRGRAVIFDASLGERVARPGRHALCRCTLVQVAARPAAPGELLRAGRRRSPPAARTHTGRGPLAHVHRRHHGTPKGVLVTHSWLYPVVCANSFRSSASRSRTRSTSCGP